MRPAGRQAPLTGDTARKSLATAVLLIRGTEITVCDVWTALRLLKKQPACC
jgi:hypothetical protein